MQKLCDKLVLSGLCLLALSFSRLTWLSVIAALTSVAMSSLCGYFENRLTDYLCVSYVALCLPVPDFVFFLPLIVYDCAERKSLIIRFCWILALPVSFLSGDPRTSAAVILASGIAFLLQHRTSSQAKTRDALFALADDNRERVSAIESKNRELTENQDYEVRLATLAERNRIAREIHDSVGHLLTRSLLQLAALSVTHPGDTALTEELGHINGTLYEAMDSIRSSVHDLHDEALDLRLRIEALIDGFGFCPVGLRYDAGELPGAVKTCFIAVVGEALNNIARHSGATAASVIVTEHPAFCQLIIEDNGTAKAGAGGIGLQNMADRVDALGGIFRVDRKRGFRIFISVPKTP